MLPSRPSFAGHGLFERLRSTAFALLGTTAAMALGLVALAAHQGWPDFPIVPIPGDKAKVGMLDSPVARAANTPGGERVGARADVQPAASRSRKGSFGETGFLGSRRRTGPPPAASVGIPAGVEAAPAPVSGSPTSSAPQQPAPAPTSSPASPLPAPSPTPSAPPVATVSSPGKGHAYGKLKTGPPPKPVHPAPPATPSLPTATPSPPPTVPAPPASQEVSEGPGQGHGHAYGHGK